jgi:hypothetical protein
LLQALAQLVKRADISFRESALGEKTLRLSHDAGDAIFLFDNCVAPCLFLWESWEEESGVLW